MSGAKNEPFPGIPSDEFEDFAQATPTPTPSHLEIMRAINNLHGAVTRIENVGQANHVAITAVSDELKKQSRILANLVAWKNSIKAVSGQ